MAPRPARRDLIALDRASVRTKDADGHMHIARTPISKANVCGYAGREIPGWQDLGLHADRVYNLYRDPEELARAVGSFEGKQLLYGHKPVNAADHAPEKWIGHVSAVKWEPPYLTGRLDIVSQDGVDAVESGEHEEISCGYEYECDLTPGKTPYGEKYDGVMRNIRGNHVAMVPEGRAGRDVRALDAKVRLKDVLMSKLTPEARKTMARDLLMRSALSVGIAGFARGRMAQDQKIDMGAVLKGVTAVNAKTKARTIARALVTTTAGRLANDADMPAEQVQAVVEEVADLIKSESDDIAAAVSEPDPAAAPDPDGSDAPDMDALMSFLSGKLDDDDMAKVKAMCGKGDADDGKRRDRQPDLTAQDRDKDKPVVTKAAMDAALATTKAQAADEGFARARAHFEGVAEAQRIVRPYVGEIAKTDSAEAVYRGALDAMQVEHADRPAEVLRDLVDIHGRAKQGASRPRGAAVDAKMTAVAYDAAAFPHSTRLK